MEMYDGDVDDSSSMTWMSQGADKVQELNRDMKMRSCEMSVETRSRLGEASGQHMVTCKGDSSGRQSENQPMRRSVRSRM
eukprot:760709-Hanusia_phi.AAC.3